MNQQFRDEHVNNIYLFDMLLQKEVLLMFESQKFWFNPQPTESFQAVRRALQRRIYRLFGEPLHCH